MSSPDPAVPARALFVGAHPDDVDFGAGGLLALWARQGCEVTVVCVTDGDSGGFDDDVPREQVPELRRGEQRAAAEVLGARGCVFLGRADGFVEADRDLRRDLARVVRQVRPDAVVTHSPDRDYRFVFLYHPDHLATGAAVLAAVYPDARNAFAFPELRDEGLEPWEVPAVWLFGGPSDDRAVDVTDVLEAKVRACSAHDSQTPMLDSGVDATLRDMLGQTAREHRLPDGRFAEAYQVLDTA
jgi:LmbE family N-acetylglucosaminyl deacetylase